MATDSRYRIIIEGDASDALEKVDRVVASINKSKKAAEKFSKERNTIARDERRERFRALSDEEKRLRLTQRQIDLEKKLSRARAQGNQGRTGAIELLLARNRQTMGALGSSGGGSVGGGSSSAGGLLAGGLGRIVGIGAIGLALKSIASRMASAVQSSISFADELGDIADQTGQTRVEILKIQRQAMAAGVSSSKVLAGLSSFSAARGNALSGDASAKAIFERYGISAKDLAGKSSNLELANRVAASLGDAGPLSSDRVPLGALFGRRPEGTIAALRTPVSISNQADVEKDVKTVESINNRLENAANALKLGGVRLTAFIADNAKTLSLIPGLGGISAVTSLLGKVPGVGLLDEVSPEAKFGKRTAKSNPIPKSTSVLDLPLRDVIAGEGLSRIGFASGARDPQGAGLAQKQLQALQDLGKTAKETKTILEEGNR